jgi:hypothetical protein
METWIRSDSLSHSKVHASKAGTTSWQSSKPTFMRHSIA